MKSRIVNWLACLVFLSSCSPYQRLVHDFNRNRSSIQYLHTSNIVSEKKNIYVAIPKPVIIDPRFKSGEIKRSKAEVIPLLIYNGWNYTFDCSLGKNQIQENVNTFIHSALIRESKRSGIYQVDSLSADSYVLELEVDSLRAGGKQNTSGFFAYFVFMYMYQNSLKASSAPAYCRFHYRLRKGDQVLLDDHVSNYAQLDFLKPYPFSTQTINRYFKAHLAELLSQVLKLNIEQVVKDVNNRLSREPESTASSNSLQ